MMGSGKKPTRREAARMAAIHETGCVIAKHLDVWAEDEFGERRPTPGQHGGRHARQLTAEHRGPAHLGGGHTGATLCGCGNIEVLVEASDIFS